METSPLTATPCGTKAAITGYADTNLGFLGRGIYPPYIMLV
jgi:hypothetical protein